MNAKARFFTGAVALVLGASTVFAASGASADPGDHDRYSRDRQSSQWNQNQNDRGQYNGRRDNERFENRNDRNSGRYNNRANNRYNYQRSYTRLPNGYRRVVVRNRTYYTYDNNAYYAYSPNSRSFVLINLPGISIGF